MKKTDHLPTFRKSKLRQKRLRVLIWFSPVISLFCLVTALYLVSYQERISQGQYIRETQESQSGLVIQAGDRKEPKEPMTIQTELAGKEPSTIQADDTTDIYITPKMTYTLETYDARVDQLVSEEIPIPNGMYGLNRVELEQYLIRLATVENEGLSEIQYHYQVQSFSRKAFTVRRTITERKSNYAIFLIAENGLLTAYNGERTEVYERTKISLGDFPLEQQAMLTQGIYMRTLTDYYDFLETYSS